MSKRELLGLITLAHVANQDGAAWELGYDPNGVQPNDGFITDGDRRLEVEQKVIPQMSKQETLDAILSTYAKYELRGRSYGSGRILVIFANKASEGPIQISRLRDEIVAKGSCPFDRVMFLSAVSERPDRLVFQMSEHYPGNGLAQIDVSPADGRASVPYCSIRL